MSLGAIASLHSAFLFVFKILQVIIDSISHGVGHGHPGRAILHANTGLINRLPIGEDGVAVSIAEIVGHTDCFLSVLLAADILPDNPRACHLSVSPVA